MVPATLLLAMAWSLAGICSSQYLDLGGYVGDIVRGHAGFIMFLPAAFFLVSFVLSFATGSSWGTFGILIPIVVAATGTNDLNMLTIAVAADHISPISDTTIMASAGAQCHHIDHVSTQIPYALVVIAACVIGYIVAGITDNEIAGIIAGYVALFGEMIYIYNFKMKDHAAG